MHQATKMLVQAGVIPKNTLQQLVNWRLVPEGYVESHGAQPVSLDMGDSEKVGRFTDDLCAAITKDMAEIRETELDRSGSYRKALLEFEHKHLNDNDVSSDVFVDRLGRVITPAEQPWTQLKRVQFAGEQPHKVVKKEKRYAGDKVVAFVIYLEAKKGEPHA